MAGAAATLVRFTYEQLADPGCDLSAQVEAAFGRDGLGICVVDGVPGYPEKRAALLPLASQLASLPAEQLEELEDPASKWNFGWSHGREKLEAGRVGASPHAGVPAHVNLLLTRCVDTPKPGQDTAKGSFYANPLTDVPTDSEELQQQFPHFCRPNIWPKRSLPALEPALKDLGALICRVGLLLAHHCDAYVAAKAEHPSAARMERTIAESRCCKSRLLHYFPPTHTQTQPSTDKDGADVSSWCVMLDVCACCPTMSADTTSPLADRCGWHLDHGSLTGLTCASYFDEAGQQVPPPDEAAGLYIRSRSGVVVRARFEANQLAFQMGEATQVHSGGLLVATPHCVRAPTVGAAGVARNAFAVFMQPHFDAPMDAPPGKLTGADVGIAHWQPGQTFGDFAAAKVALYYGQ